MFHKEGHKIIFIAFVIIVASFLLIDNFVETPWLQTTLWIVLLGCFIIDTSIFQKPKTTNFIKR